MRPDSALAARTIHRSSRTGRGAAATMVAVGLWAVASTLPSASAAVTPGTAAVVTPPDASSAGGAPLTDGGSATPFTLQLPVGAGCTGDSANGGYRVQSYMVSEAVSPDTLTFSSAGPVGGAGFRQPLFRSIGGGPYVNEQTAAADTVGGPGLVVAIATFNFAVYAPGDVPVGPYNVGIACTLGPASATQLDKLWNVRMVVTAAAADTPAGFTWTAAQVVATTTTSSTTSTTTASTTSTSSTSTTSTSTTSTTTLSSTSSSSTTTSTTRASTTTTSTAGGSTTTTMAGGSTTTTTRPPSVMELARTGGSILTLVLLVALLLDLGWWVVRRGRTPHGPPSSTG